MRTSLESASRLIRSCSELLLLLLVVGAVSTPLQGSEQRTGFAGGIPDASLPTLAQVNHAIELSGGYLERACGPNGKFVYEIDIHTGKKSNSYNIVRHAGAIYALAMLNHAQPDPQAVEAMVRAAAFLRQNYIGPGVHPGLLVVWSEPLAEQSKSHHQEAELGATGLGLAALAETRRVAPKAVPLEDLQKLGRFLLFLQKDDGSFINKYRAESGPVEDWESLYYPGEAALAFVALYEADHSHEWLVAAGKALSFLSTRRAALSTVPADHWALIATAKLLPYCGRDLCPGASLEELIQHAIQVCNSILREQFRGSSAVGISGAFDPGGRTAPTATRLEGLLSALEFLPKDELRAKIEAAAGRGIGFLLRMQIGLGSYSGGMPGAFRAGVRDASEIRIDYVQHSVCAWLLYKQLSLPTGTSIRPITGHDSGHIRILFGGDTDFGESYQDEYAKEGAGNILVEKGYDYSVANLSRILRAVDYRILNLETPLTLHRDSSLKGKEYLHYSDPTKAPAVFGRFGPTVYSLANNHTLDQGEVGLDDTLASLKTAGARYFGVGKDLPDATMPFIQEFRLGDTSFSVAVFGGLEYTKKYRRSVSVLRHRQPPRSCPYRRARRRESDSRSASANAQYLYDLFHAHVGKL